MFFLNNQNEEIKNLYFSYLKSVCALSKLFSDSVIPYLNYRALENIFCKAFQAENISRDDLAYDSIKEKIGIGIKTFINKGANFEKVAEFNQFSKELRSLNDIALANRLAELRNARIEFANRNYNVNYGVYHCIAREKNKLKIFETKYTKIEINKINIIKTGETSIKFSDNENNYLFNFSKSTLYQKFDIPQTFIELDIEIIDDPLTLIQKIFKETVISKKNKNIPGLDYVILPLYSVDKNGIKYVPEKSGLNQWNAGGRKRDYGEIYIPVPIMIHKRYPGFFPDRERSFYLIVPSGERLLAKLCQDNSKAIMTNPNKALSDWLLRKVLNLKEGELLTYNKLKIIGIDSVRITKLDDDNYKIDFAKIGSYENFKMNFLEKPD